MLQLNALKADWSFSLEPNILTKPTGRSPDITSGTFEPIVKCTIQPLVIKCEADFLLLKNSLYNPASPLKIRCPVFHQDRIRAVYYQTVDYTYSYYTQYEPATRSIRFYRSVYDNLANTEILYPTQTLYRNCYYVGSNASADHLTAIDPNLPVQWLIPIRPINDRLNYIRASKNQPYEIAAIDCVAGQLEDDMLALDPTRALCTYTPPPPPPPPPPPTTSNRFAFSFGVRLL